MLIIVTRLHKKKIVLLNLALKFFQFESLALVMLLIQFLVSFIFSKCIVFYQKANSMKTIIFLLSAKIILHHGNPTYLIPAIAFIIFSWGIFSFMKKSLKPSIRREPFPRISVTFFCFSDWWLSGQIWLWINGCRFRCL